MKILIRKICHRHGEWDDFRRAHIYSNVMLLETLDCSYDVLSVVINLEPYLRLPMLTVNVCLQGRLVILYKGRLHQFNCQTR